MIKSITVINYLDQSLVLELLCPEKSGFVVQEVTGLGPSKANINITENATSNGASFNSARVNARNIVLTLKLLASPTVELIRQKSYKYFPLTKRVKLIIETDTRICETYGHVEANEPVIFSQSETTQISIICPDPNFYSVGNTVTVFSGVEPMFDFPFSNDSLTDDLFIMGDIILNQEKTVYYTGDSEVGVTIMIHSMGDVQNLTIYNVTTRESMLIDTTKLALLTGFGIIEGDDIIISTVKGHKTIQLLRNGVYTNILNALGKNADWFQLTQGDNIFAFTAESGDSYLQFRVENQIVYEGV
jgi:hypothetical protein